MNIVAFMTVLITLPWMSNAAFTYSVSSAGGLGRRFRWCKSWIIYFCQDLVLHCKCWMARALNQNYVRANLTATIAWDLVNSFYDRLAFAGAGMLRAVEP